MYNIDITNKRWIVMSKTIPMIISNRSILIRAKDSNDFVAFSMPGINLNSNIPFYHMFAQKNFGVPILFQAVYAQTVRQKVFKIYFGNNYAG